MRPGIGFYRTEQCLWVYVSYLSMGFLDIGIKKHQEHRRENLLLLSKVHGDCVTSHGLTAYHLFLGSYFEATLTTGMARGTDTLWLSSELFFTFTWIYRKYADTINNSSICRVFVVFSRKSSGTHIHAKNIWLKKCFEAYPGYEAKSISSK